MQEEKELPVDANADISLGNTDCFQTHHVKTKVYVPHARRAKCAKVFGEKGELTSVLN